jgi:predicted nucleotidyltransferase
MKTLNDLLQVSLDCVLFTCVAGSRAYGTHTHENDEDIRGVYAVRADRYLDLETPPPQLADERGNIVYFSLRRFIELLAVANPNVLELLFIPPDCVRNSTLEMDRTAFAAGKVEIGHVSAVTTRALDAGGRAQSRLPIRASRRIFARRASERP